MRRGTLDIVYGVVILAVGGFLLWETTGAQYADTMGLGIATDPAFYPRVLIGVWLLAGAAILIRGMLSPRDMVPDQDWRHLAGFAALTAAYTWLLTAIGFLFASVLLCVASMLVLGYRRPFGIVLAGFAFPLAVWYIFTFILQIALPISPWFDRL